MFGILVVPIGLGIQLPPMWLGIAVAPMGLVIPVVPMCLGMSVAPTSFEIPAPNHDAFKDWRKGGDDDEAPRKVN